MFQQFSSTLINFHQANLSNPQILKTIKLYGKDLKLFIEKLLENEYFFTTSDNERCTENLNLVTFTEEILNGKLHFLCSGNKT